ncbi:MAG: citrate synthase [Bacteroidales bacterium]
MEDTVFLSRLSDSIRESCQIESELFDKYDVKRGLRNKDKTGVLVGLTNIGEVMGYKKEGDKVVAIPGRLLYRGIDIEDITQGFQKENRHGFAETVFLLLTGKLPGREELEKFSTHMASLRPLPDSFIKDMILSMKGKDVLNMLARSVLGLYILDDYPDDISLPNMIKQSLNIIAKFSTIIAYSYQAFSHYYQGETLSIRYPRENLTAAENFLYMIKGECSQFTKLEADLLDLALVLHAEHGGGNNSTFTIRVTSSSETDIYSAVVSAIGSLKGPLHGGANLKVLDMMDDLKKNVKDWKDEKEVERYLVKILNKEVFDKTGKIYGVGHAVYTISDPRAGLLKAKARELAIEKNRYDEFQLYEVVEKLAPGIFLKFKGENNGKTVCINVDFYSGLVYSFIGIPKELFTPLFAMARIAGWCTHRIEELTFSAKRIIRPAFKYVYGWHEYVPLDSRDGSIKR